MSKAKYFAIVLIAIIVATQFLSGCANRAKHFQEDVVSINPEKLRHAQKNIFSGGQPSEAEFHQLKEKGLKTIISLRPPSEVDWDQRALLTELGFNYINLPIQGASGIDEKNARALMNLIDQHDHEPLLVHCGSGNRVGALIATAEHKINQTDIEKSIMIGKKWGLTKLEPKVREVLKDDQ